MRASELSARPVGVAVRSRRRLYRDVLATLLAGQAGFTVVGRVADGAGLRELCRLRRPDLVLFEAAADLDASLGLLCELRAGRIRVVVLYEELSRTQLAAAHRAGVERLVPVSHGLPALLTVLREYAAVARGDAGDAVRGVAPFGAGLAGSGAGSGEAVAGLTDHERVLLALVASGHTADRIAALLHTSAHAVEHRKRRIYAKLDAANQCQAVAHASRLGMVSSAAELLAGLGSAHGPGLPALTARESQILRSIAAGDTVRQTARSLGIRQKTVENTQARLFRKLGCRNRAETVARAIELGLLDPPL